MVIHSDMNMLSVLDYSVNILKIKHIIVCGHYECGGVKAALENISVGIIDNWIRHIKDSYRFQIDELMNIENEKEKFDRFVELNIKRQVLNLAATSIVQHAWSIGQDLTIHGWVYGIDTGLIKDLDVNFSSQEDIKNNPIYKLEFNNLILSKKS